jgi:hypothetical protein
MARSWWMEDAADWTDEERADVAEVIKYTARDDTGISYEVSLVLRSMAATAREEGEDRVTCWTKRVHFGTTDDTCAGGGAFIRASSRQEFIAEQIAAVVWGWKRRL